MYITHSVMDYKATFCTDKLTRFDINYLLTVAAVWAYYYVVSRLKHYDEAVRYIRYNISREIYQKLLI